MASSTFLRLLVIFFGISHLIGLNAVPITRIGRLMPEPEVLAVSATPHLVTHQEEKINSLEELQRRMDVELNDYPGSGANHRHTPWPPQP